MARSRSLLGGGVDFTVGSDSSSFPIQCCHLNLQHLIVSALLVYDLVQLHAVLHAQAMYLGRIQLMQYL